MKNQVKLLAIILTLIFSMVSSASKVFLPAANATYVEGSITQNTIWTLVDSPFVVSNHLRVYSNATLVIEPGVEVKFGGSFSLNIDGEIIANGTKDKMIKFTSNRYAPQSGDWNTLNFAGLRLSYLINCIVEYGTNGVSINNGHAEITDSDISHCQENGITITNGDLNIQNSRVSHCLQNGITATASDLSAQNNTIMQNTDSGIYIIGNGHNNIQRNTIIANREGIVLSGNQTSGVNISQNIISANRETGILINAATHSDIVITNNSVSSNKNGFYVSTPTSTYITNNAISYNENGFFYDQGNHTVYDNDIYGNDLGMDASSYCTVDAEHNYWGDSSGPYHASLNPTGRGNAIGSNDTNIDFIFFLTRPVGYINARPMARLLTDKVLVSPNEAIMFFGTESSDEGHVDRYFFEFDDGNDSSWTTLSVFAHRYSTIGSYHANLTVMDDFGATSIRATVTIAVQNLSSLYANVDVSKSTVQEGENVSIIVHVSNGIVPIENASVMLFSIKGGTFNPATGLTNTTGIFVAVFRVPDVAELANVRIVARASINGYADGSGYEYLEVLPFLTVSVIPNSSTIKSEGSTLITISVTSSEQPVANAYLTITSNNGNLSSTTGITNLNGVFSSVLSAPLTTQILNITITANVRRDRFLDGVGHASVTVEPKTLNVHIIAEPDVTISEAKANVIVTVEYEGTPIEGADVNVATQNGTFPQSAGLTNVNGSMIFVFTAPPVNAQATIAITANASRFGYAGNQNQIFVTVNPRTFNITVKAYPNSIKAEEVANITVSVLCNEDGKPVAGALVSMSSSDGNFSEISWTTDSKGHCSFVFNSPGTEAQITAIITANVTKNGYVDGWNQTRITVTPRAIVETGGGFPLLTILMILIPIVIVVIVVVLVKLKIITFSSQEET